MKEFWDARYLEEGFAYGSEPNTFVKDQLNAIAAKGRILFPAEGEGRNAVFAAQKGWEVHAYDISSSGKLKAEQLAAEAGVTLDYRINGFLDVQYPDAYFDALAFSYVHLPSVMQASVFERHLPWMKPEALVIFEGFSVSNLPLRALNPAVGGPDNIDMLYTVEGLTQLLERFKNLKVWEEAVTLSEGKYHVGDARVIRAHNWVE